MVALKKIRVNRGMFLVLLFVFDMHSACAYAEATSNVESSHTENQLTHHPTCFDSPKDVDKIKNSMKALSKDKIKANPSLKATKYDEYKTLLKEESQESLLARLIYSETKAAKCKEQEAKIYAPIADTILNRIRRRNGDVQSVVFEYNNFASSLNNYEGSGMAEFLCPKDLVLWDLAVKKSHELKQKNAKTDFPSDGFNYYLFKHFPSDKKVNPPDWSKSLVEIKTAESAADCIRFYRNPSWK